MTKEDACTLVKYSIQRCRQDLDELLYLVESAPAAQWRFALPRFKQDVVELTRRVAKLSPQGSGLEALRRLNAKAPMEALPTQASEMKTAKKRKLSPAQRRAISAGVKANWVKRAGAMPPAHRRAISKRMKAVWAARRRAKA